MEQEQEEFNSKPDYKPFTDKELIKVITIGFAIAVYAYIFLKITILE